MAIAYFNGQLVPREEVRLSPDDRGFLFADGVYEVVRVHGGLPFALDLHRARLSRSLREIRLGWAGIADLERIVRRLLAANDLDRADALVYLQVTRGVAPRLHAFPPADTPPTVYVSARPYAARTAPDAGEATAVLAPDIRWARCDIKSVGLLPNVLARQRALERGADEAIFVRDGIVTEGTRTNVAVVMGGVLVTHPLTNVVLPGVTREIVLSCCADAGVPVAEAPIPVDDLAACDEVLLLGTTMEVTAVVRLDDRPVSDGRAGPVATRLAAAFGDRVAAAIETQQGDVTIP